MSPCRRCRAICRRASIRSPGRLTFNIVATAIATPATGWLAARLGRKRLLVGAVLGFTISSVLCGLASSLPELIVWRTCQGLMGAPLVPLSQAITLDTFPRAQHGPAMALWGIGRGAPAQSWGRPSAAT